ncbi:PREDICTED: isocitrate dehydrogenase [NADP] cytoplasmic-like [Nicrophorus vespilloides]|uniref:Isocitrate dehydrogenase [NADP] n=1 Tax=Nicrophorus vespilloides TaxID=110193 RepID=A0ABM1N4Q8_NICVS|nr:PREDICTED: isocitrate dehydrogenase [NADP] cytoplasmic-like [Nicrophorus vespilloides]
MLMSKSLARLNVHVTSISKRQTKILVSISPTFNRKYTTKSKIIVQKPIVEIGGDEMSKIVFDKIKQKLIIPYVNLERDYYDCSLANRNATGNEVVAEATAAILKYNVGIKCSTITPDEEKSKEYKLKQIWPSPNTMIRNALNGTQFRESIICSNVNKFVPKWTKPIIICRHTFGDQYAGKDIVIDKPGRVSLVYTTRTGEHHNYDVKDFDGKGVAMLTYNTLDSIQSFAEACFQMALERELPLIFSSKYTHLKQYDAMFYSVFQDLYLSKYKRLMDKANLTYEHRLIDDMAACAIKSSGGFVWALKSYDGDILSDVVGQGFGSMAMMMHSLKSHDGKTILTEPAHGSVTKHYKRHLKGKQTSTNPISSIFAWSRGLHHRAKLDCNYNLLEFAELLEQCSIAVVEEGNLTRDLAYSVYGADGYKESDTITTNEFIDVIARKLELNITKIFPREVAQTAN